MCIICQIKAAAEGKKIITTARVSEATRLEYRMYKAKQDELYTQIEAKLEETKKLLEPLHESAWARIKKELGLPEDGEYAFNPEDGTVTARVPITDEKPSCGCR